MKNKNKHSSKKLGAFRRSLTYLWPQRKRIVLAIIFSIGQALTFAAGLGALIPVLQLLISDEGPRTNIFRSVADRQLDLTLEPYRPDKHPQFSPPPPAHALIIRNIGDQSPNASAAPIGSAIWPADQPDITSHQAFYEWLAAAEKDSTRRIHTQVGTDVTGAIVTLNVAPLDWKHRLLQYASIRIATLFPAANTPTNQKQALIVVFAGIIIIVAFGATCRFFAEYIVVIVATRAVMDMRRQLYRTIMYLPMTWFGKHLSETMSRAVTDFQDVQRGYRALFGKLTSEPIKAIILFIMALVLDWRITLFVVIAGPIAGSILLAIGKKVRKANRRLLAGYAHMMTVINATLAGMKIVRAHNNQTTERRRMWKADRQLLEQFIKIGKFEALSGPALEVLGALVAMAGVVYLAEYVFSGQLSPATFLMLIGCLAATFDAAKKAASIYPRLARADGACQRIFELMDSPTETTPHLQLPSLPPLQNTIEFKNLSFTYPETTRPALDNINITIRKGQKVALVGPNGSGKTTLISLLVRFLQNNTGQILFDSHDITEHNIRSLRNQISLVTQDAVVFAVTAFENIAYGLPGASEQDVIAAAQKAHAHEFISRLPEGYQTVLGEFGATLSGGERQRLALARAILRNAPIFIFDEATSQIDVDSEKKITQATREFMAGRTSFVIAHRIATITDADQIAVFDQGRLIDIGTHDQLLDRCTLYHTLYHTHTQAV